MAGDDPDPRVIALAREVERATRRVGHVEVLVRQLAADVTGLARVVDEPPADDEGAEVGRVRAWLLAEDAGQARADLTDLVEWLARVYLRYPGAVLPSCWGFHPGRESHWRGPHRRGPHRRGPHRRDPPGARTSGAPTSPARTSPAPTSPARTSPAPTSPARTSPARTSAAPAASDDVRTVGACVDERGPAACRGSERTTRPGRVPVGEPGQNRWFVAGHGVQPPVEPRHALPELAVRPVLRGGVVQRSVRAGDQGAVDVEAPSAPQALGCSSSVR